MTDLKDKTTEESTQDDRSRRQDDKTSTQDDRSKRQDGITVDNTTYKIDIDLFFTPILLHRNPNRVASLPHAAFFEELFAFKTLSRRQSHTHI